MDNLQPAAAETLHAVSPAVTEFFSLILVALIASLALEEKLHAKKSLIVGIFAVVCLLIATALDILPFGGVVLPGGQSIEMPIYIPAVDWSVIAIILGSSLFVDVTSRSGVFTWIAIKLTKASRGDPLRLLWYYGVMTVLFSAVLNNVTAMIIVGSLTAVSLNKLQRRDILLGFLLVEGLLTNVGGLLTLISSVPNIIVGHAAGIGFVDFFLQASPYVFITTAATIVLGARLFGIQKLITAEQRAQAQEVVAGFDENDGIESRWFFYFSAAILLAFIGVIASASVLPLIKELGMGFIALAFAAVVLVFYKHEVDQFYRAVDWDLLGFFAALFVIINVMEHASVLQWLGHGITFIIGDGGVLGTGTLLVSSAVFSSITDNIPLVAMLSKILNASATPGDSALWWAVVFGANLGGNITPIGSASTLVAVTIIVKHKLPISFLRFVVLAVPFALMQIGMATVYVLTVLR